MRRDQNDGGDVTAVNGNGLWEEVLRRRHLVAIMVLCSTVFLPNVQLDSAIRNIDKRYCRCELDNDGGGDITS